MSIDLSIEIGSLKMKNPLTTASGTYGQGDIFEDFYDINILGAVTTKSVTLERRDGNPPPRIAETYGGYLNSIGLQNPGIKEFIKKYNDFFQSLKTNVIVSIAGNTIEEYQSLAKIISNELAVDAIEINISCPNVKEKGLQFSSSPESCASVVSQVRKETDLPLITKLTPNIENNVDVAIKAYEAGSDAIAIMNTLKGMAVDLKTKKPLLKNVYGGFSGPAVKPVALRWVHELSTKMDAPIIAMGGVFDYKDVLEFIICGAKAVSIGTANFINPLTVPEVLKDMTDWLEKNNISSLSELRGSIIV